MGSQYRVTAGCVVAKVASDTGEGYFYQGAVLPDGVSQQEKERLVAIGLVAEIDVPEVVQVEVPVTIVDPLDGLDVDGLKAYAAAHGIDLGRATTEDGIRSKITEAGQA